MYIVDNVDLIQNTYKCNKRIAKWLIHNKTPLLSRKDGVFYFAKTSELDTKLNQLPWYLRLLGRVFEG